MLKNNHKMTAMLRLMSKWIKILRVGPTFISCPMSIADSTVLRLCAVQWYQFRDLQTAVQSRNKEVHGLAKEGSYSRKRGLICVELFVDFLRTWVPYAQWGEVVSYFHANSFHKIFKIKILFSYLRLNV